MGMVDQLLRVLKGLPIKKNSLFIVNFHLCVTVNVFLDVFHFGLSHVNYDYQLAARGVAGRIQVGIFDFEADHPV